MIIDEITDRRILIVDDEEDVRCPIIEFLEMAGFILYSASSAEEALEILKSNNNIPIVITDIMLPGLDGLKLTGLIRSEYDSDVIIMTGYSKIYSYEDAINKGASDIVFKPVRFEELMLRLKRVLRERQFSFDRKQMLDKLQKLAVTDGLTQLYNSRHFYNQLKSEVDRTKRYRHPLSLLLLDIDHFKNYNDNYGHLKGDKVLVKIGSTIKSCLRRLDSAYRYGGEEFTVILPETNCPEAVTVANRIMTAIRAVKFRPEPEIFATVTVSIGATQYSPKEKLSSFVQRADSAMYISKQKGRDRVTALIAEASTE